MNKFEIKEIINQNICKLRKTGFFSVFLSSVLSRVLTFLGGIVLVRIMSKEDYGLYTYVLNSYGMLFILSDFGCCQAMMQYRSEFFKDKERNNDYFTKAYKYGMLLSSISVVFLLLSPFFYPFNYKEAARLTQFLCLLPYFTTTNSFISSNLRVQMQNKRFAAINIVQTAVHYGMIIPLSFFWNVTGAVLANYLIAISTLFFSVAVSKDCLRFDWKSDILTWKEKKKFLLFAAASQFDSSIGTLFHLIDIFFIGFFTINAEVISSYKVASTLPQVLMFVPNSILIYIVPIFARHVNDTKWIGHSFKKLLFSTAVINAVLTISCGLSVSVLIPVIYGEQYSDASGCAVILLIAFFFSGSFQIPAANVIYTQHKVGMNVLITVITNMINCFLDIVLIQKYGSIGAALATLFVSIISGLLTVGYAIYWIKKSQKKICK